MSGQAQITYSNKECEGDANFGLMSHCQRTVLVRQWKHWPVNGPFIKFLNCAATWWRVLNNDRAEEPCWSTGTPAEYTFRVSASVVSCNYTFRFNIRWRQGRWRLSNTFQIDNVQFSNLLILFSCFLIFKLFIYICIILSRLREGGGLPATESTSKKRFLLSKQV